MLEKDMNFNNKIAWMFFPCRPFDAWIAIQEKLLGCRRANGIPQFLVMTTHPPCFSLGRGESNQPEKNFKVPIERNGDHLFCRSIPVFPANRGGAVTYHSPGILGCYTIFAHLPLALADYFLIYEKALSTILTSFGLHPSKYNPHAPEMWIDNRKIASVGVRFIGPKSNTILYGFNLNVNGDLSPFSYIYPCGRRDEYQEATSLEAELGYPMDIREIAKQIAKEIISHIQRAIIKEKPS